MIHIFQDFCFDIGPINKVWFTIDPQSKTMYVRQIKVYKDIAKFSFCSRKAGVDCINILRERFLYKSAFFAKILLPQPKRN